MSVGIFLDSNILIYSHDEDGGEKYLLANQWMQDYGGVRVVNPFVSTRAEG